MKRYLRYEDVEELMSKNLEHPYSKKVMDKIFHVIKSFYLAFHGKSQIDGNTEDGQYILNYQGMSGKKTRHLYNNIMNNEDVKYLEIGTWYGSSSISAIYQNDIQALFIDNWSQFGGDKKIFQDAIGRFLTKKADCKLLESDCWKVNTKKIGTGYNVYLYDGGHTEEDHFKSLDYYYNNLDDVFIFMVDDWCWGDVRDGTWRAIEKLDLKVRFCHEVLMSPEERVNFPNHAGRDNWWNGIAIFVLEK